MYNQGIYPRYGQQGYTAQANYMAQPGYTSQPGQGWAQQAVYVQPYDARVKVKGRNGADAFWMPTDSFAVLFDEDEDVMYLKSTDAGGYPSVDEYEYWPRKREEQPAASPAVTREEFDALVAKVEGLSLTKPAPRARKAATDGE